MTPFLDKLHAAFLALLPEALPVQTAAATSAIGATAEPATVARSATLAQAKAPSAKAAIIGACAEANDGNEVVRSSCASLPSVTPAPAPGNVKVAPSAAPSAVGPASVPSAPPSPCQRVNAAVKGYHLDVKVGPEQVVAAAELLDREGFAIDTVTGVDWIASNEMEIVYDFFHPRQSLHAVLRTRVPRANPEVPTISRVFPGANWHERETHEFFGIKFLGHPNLTPFLLPEDATYHPLRKDFVHV